LGPCHAQQRSRVHPRFPFPYDLGAAQVLQDGKSWDRSVQLIDLALCGIFSLISISMLHVSLLIYLQLRRLHIPVLLYAAHSTQLGTNMAVLGILRLSRPFPNRLIWEIRSGQNCAGLLLGSSQSCAPRPNLAARLYHTLPSYEPMIWSASRACVCYQLNVSAAALIEAQHWPRSRSRRSLAT
jgi:hypothetical protein